MSETRLRAFYAGEKPIVTISLFNWLSKNDGQSIQAVSWNVPAAVTVMPGTSEVLSRVLPSDTARVQLDLTNVSENARYTVTATMTLANPTETVKEFVVLSILSVPA